MNVRLIKNIAFAASGALFGALGAYLATKTVLTREFEKTLEEETAKLRKYVDSLAEMTQELTRKIEIYEDAGLSYETACAIAEKNRGRIEKASEKISKDIKDSIVNDQNYVTYSKNFTKKDGDTKVQEVSGEEDEHPEVTDLTKDEKDEDQNPYLISNEAFSDDHEEYRKVSCTFYTEDKVLCESAHNEKIDISSVGKENLDFFYTNDLDLLYIRNDYLGIDYEIDKYEGSYTYEVLGEESLEE